MQLISMTPVPGCVIVRRETYLGLQTCSPSRKRWTEQIPESQQVIYASQSQVRKTEQLPPLDQMFFAVQDEYSYSAREFNFLVKPN